MLKIIATGNLGRDPELRYTPAGKAVTSFSVAANRQYTGANGEKVKETVWLNVSAWDKLAEICKQYLQKGSKVLVEGRLAADKATGGPRVWTGNDGLPRTSYEITAESVEFLSTKGEGSPAGPAARSNDSEFSAPEEDSVPF